MVVGDITVGQAAVAGTTLTFVPAVGTTFIAIHVSCTNGWVALGSALTDSLILNSQNILNVRFGITNTIPLFTEAVAGTKNSYSVLQME